MPILAREDASLAKAIAQAEPNHRIVTKVKFGFPGACARKAISHDIRLRYEPALFADMSLGCSNLSWQQRVTRLLIFCSKEGAPPFQAAPPLPPSLPPPLTNSIAPSSLLFLHPFFRLTVLAVDRLALNLTVTRDSLSMSSVSIQLV